MQLRIVDCCRCNAQEFFRERPEFFPRPFRLRIEPHAPVAVFSPRSCTQIERFIRTRIVEMCRCSERSHATLEIDMSIQRFDEVDTFEPPVSEQLRIEWNCDQLSSRALNRIANSTEKSCEVFRMSQHLCARTVRLVRVLVTETCAVGSHPPELEAAGI